MDRRQLLASGAATGALAFAPWARAAQPAGDAALTIAFDAIFADMVASSPEFATSLGLDKDANARLRHRLDDYGPRAVPDQLARNRRYQARLDAVEPAGLSTRARIDREVVLYSIQETIDAGARFGLASPQRPYATSHRGGAWFSLPDFLDSTHSIATTDDAEAYINRLAQVGRALDGDTAVQREQAAKGRLAPDFSLDLALAQMTRLRETAPAENGLTQSLVTRASAAKLPGDYTSRAARLVEQQVYPALDRQIALIKQLRPGARSQAGVGAISGGDALYAAALKEATTTTRTPAQVHRMGLDQVADLSAQLDAILRGQGMTQGTLGERLAALNVAPAQLYPDTNAGRADLIAGLNAGVHAMQARLPRAFTNPPDAPLEIRRVPPEIQDGASNGYYYRAPLDGSRPAIYWINLKSVGDWPRYSLPSLTYHEGVPGHHLQISTAQRAPTHPLRKIAFFNAYLEGWALYAEQLADELGGYATPLERAGYLQSFLFRAARLVVDTGIHTLDWSREKATQYLVDNVGFARARSQREIERYCVQPGQACSYKIGHASWLKARAEAQRIAGAKFDLKHFHDVLESGAMPLSMLERLTAERARAMA